MISDASIICKVYVINFVVSLSLLFLKCITLVYYAYNKNFMRKSEKNHAISLRKNRKLTKTINTILRRLLNSAFLYKCSALVYVFLNSIKENCFRKTKPPHMHVHMWLNLVVSRGKRVREVYFVGVIIAPFHS